VLHATHQAWGAHFTGATQPALPELYADPSGTEAGARAAEYEAARSGAGLVDLAERGLLAVSGPLRQKFLHGLLSNDVQNRAAGQGCVAALMDVKGHVLALLRVLVDSDSVLLELTAARLSEVEALLQHYRVAAPVRFARPSAVVLALVGAQADEVAARAGLAAPESLAMEQHVTRSFDGQPVRVARASDLPQGLVLHVAPEQAAPLWQALCAAGARPVGRRALDALRVERGLPWYERDVSADNLLHETGLVSRYHSSTKGCYVGQEVIARLEARGGHVNKALRGLQLQAPCAAGARLRVEGQEVGRVTTAALSPRLGPVALAYVHRNHFAAGTPLEIDGQHAHVVVLPFEPPPPAPRSA
jgi:folate-binding protein YgfZ